MTNRNDFEARCGFRQRQGPSNQSAFPPKKTSSCFAPRESNRASQYRTEHSSKYRPPRHLVRPSSAHVSETCKLGVCFNNCFKKPYGRSQDFCYFAHSKKQHEISLKSKNTPVRLVAAAHQSPARPSESGSSRIRWTMPN